MPDAPYEYGNACVNICHGGYNIDYNNKCTVKCSSNYFKKVEYEYKCVPNFEVLFMSYIGECVEQYKFGENYIGKN